LKQVVQNARGGGARLLEVPEPRIAPGQILVDVHASLISAGTERMVTAFAEKSLLGKARARPDLVRQVRSKMQRDGLRATWQSVNARLSDPLPLGYSAAGLVIEVGAGLEGRFRPGDRVAIAGAGLANHAETNLVPGNLAVPLPERVPFEEACFATLGAIALHSVRLVRPQLGEWVGVIGVGLVGLLALQFARLSGARVITFDYDRHRLARAQALGAEHTCCLADGDPESLALDVSGGLGCDAVILAAATDSAEPFETAAAIARDRATVCLVGISGTEFPYRPFMHKELSIVVARSYGPGRYDSAYERQGMAYPEGYVRWTETENLRTVTELIAAGRLDVHSLITHRLPFAEAEAAYRMIMTRSEPHLGVVLDYPSRKPDCALELQPVPLPAARSGPRPCVIGVIGAGRFARTIILPRLAKLPDVTLKSIASARGLSAEVARSQFGFKQAVSDPEAVLSDPDITAVIILTPHGSHAALTASALRAGKPVLVEKPLALDRAELGEVIAARRESGAFFQIGFNRRFAPLTKQIVEALSNLDSQKHIVIRANAGRASASAWESDDEHGGGRLLGEACHFVDLAQHLAGAPIVAVHAAAIQPGRGPAEDIGAQIEFAGGSLATIAYTTRGDTAFSKESIEVFCGGRVFRIEDFRQLTMVRDGKTATTRTSQNKGHQAALAAFVQAVTAGEPAPIPEAALINSSLATIALKEALLQGSRVRLV
jgi:predicted dehydrogenase/threonine dehydrogenase-like Zn-dependent dehydrogenase